MIFSANIMVAAVVAIFSVLLASCEDDAGRLAADNDGGDFIQVEVYRALNAKSILPCYGHGILSECGQRLYTEPRSPDFETGFTSTESSWYNCSDDAFECVSNTGYLLAVPRRDLEPGLRYRTHGAELVVEACFKGAGMGGEACEIALISSRCVEECQCVSQDAKDVGVLFYYSPEVGVTAIFAAPDLGDMRTAAPMHSWTLVADEGFLKKKLSLPKAEGLKPCELI